MYELVTQWWWWETSSARVARKRFEELTFEQRSDDEKVAMWRLERKVLHKEGTGTKVLSWEWAGYVSRVKNKVGVPECVNEGQSVGNETGDRGRG